MGMGTALSPSPFSLHAWDTCGRARPGRVPSRQDDKYMLGFRAGAVNNLELTWERRQQAPTFWASWGRLRRVGGAGLGALGKRQRWWLAVLTPQSPGPRLLTVHFPAGHSAA